HTLALGVYWRIWRRLRCAHFPYTTLFRSASGTTNDLYSIAIGALNNIYVVGNAGTMLQSTDQGESWNLQTGISTERLNNINFKKDRKSTRLNSSHVKISYAVFCLKKKRPR